MFFYRLSFHEGTQIGVPFEELFHSAAVEDWLDLHIQVVYCTYFIVD
jgi:hypothetical protein